MQRHDLRQRTPDVQGRTLPDQRAGRIKAPTQKRLGVFEKQ